MHGMMISDVRENSKSEKPLDFTTKLQNSRTRAMSPLVHLNISS
jgi:hypothetical protein